MVTYFSSQ